MVRRATAEDALVLARQRMIMYRDIHRLAESECETLLRASHEYFASALPAGEYLAWLAAAEPDSDRIVGGAGLQLWEALPSIRHYAGDRVVRGGRSGIVRNVFTEAAYRRRGIARLLMEHVLAEARRLRVAQLTLHASDAGRPLYASMGFEPTNEMRYTGSLEPSEYASVG